VSGMTKADRDQLMRLAGKRAKLAKSKVVEREKVLLAEATDLMTAEFEARDQLWAEATTIAEEACRKANDQIAAQCSLLGIPANKAPKLDLMWRSRSMDFSDPSRKAELRRLALDRLAALTATAKSVIDEQLLEVETALISDGLQSDDAMAFLEKIPTPEQLMPSLSLDDLGVRHWQPPQGAAAELLTPSTTAGRKRKAVLRAIAANPGASDRKVGEIAGVDHKTVAKYRGGEIPAITGDFLSDDAS